MATLSKPWFFSGNRLLDDSSTNTLAAASRLFALKELLRGGISGTNGPEGARPSSAYWSVVSSSDGTTFSAADNLGAATFNGSKWNWANEGSAHSHFVLRSPSTFQDGPIELCINLKGTTVQRAEIVVAKGSGAFSGGSTTNRPTAAHEAVYDAQDFIEALALAGRCHLIIDADGSFWFLCSRNAQGIVDFALTIQALATVRTSNDAARFAMHCRFRTTARGALDWTADAGGLTWVGFARDGVTPVTSSNGGLWQPFFQGSTDFSSNLTTVNAIDSKMDMVETLPLFDKTTGQKGMRGRFPDTWYVGQQKAVGALEPSDTAETIVVGGIAIPGSIALSL